MRAWRKVMAAHRRVCDSRHVQADCQEPGSAPEPYARQSSMGYDYVLRAGDSVRARLERDAERSALFVRAGTDRDGAACGARLSPADLPAVTSVRQTAAAHQRHCHGLSVR